MGNGKFCRRKRLNYEIFSWGMNSLFGNYIESIHIHLDPSIVITLKYPRFVSRYDEILSYVSLDFQGSTITEIRKSFYNSLT